MANQELVDFLVSSAEQMGVPPEIALSVAYTESSLNPNAVGPKTRSGDSAVGVMQLMDGTAKSLGVDRHDPFENILGGIAYLKQNYDQFGDWQSAVAAYHAGPGAVKKAGGVPDTHDGLSHTKDYVSKILDTASRLQESGLFSSGKPAAKEEESPKGFAGDYLKAALNYQPTEPVKQQEAKKETGDFMSGVKTALHQIPQTGYGVAAGLGAAGENLFGEGGLSTALKKWGIDKYQDKEKDLQQYNKDIYEFDTAFNRAKDGDFGALVDWLQYGLGYAGTQIVSTVATGGLGSIAGRAALSGTAKTILAGTVEKKAAEIAASEAGKKLSAEEVKRLAAQSVAKDIGAGIAVGAQNTAMEGGEIFGDLVKESEKRGTPLTGEELLRGFGATIAAAGTETAVDMLGLGALTGRIKVGGPSGRVARGAAGGVIGGGTEFGTEYIQTGMEQWGKGQDLSTPEAARERFNAGALGAIGGTAAGGGIGLLSSPTRETKPSDITNPTISIEEATAEAQKYIDEAGSSLDALHRAIPDIDQTVVNPSSMMERMRESGVNVPPPAGTINYERVAPGSNLSLATDADNKPTNYDAIPFYRHGISTDEITLQSVSNDQTEAARQQQIAQQQQLQDEEIGQANEQVQKVGEVSNPPANQTVTEPSQQSVRSGEAGAGVPVQAQSKVKQDRKTIYPEKDSALVAIAKLGGMDTQELLNNGFDQSDISVQKGAKVSKKTGQLGKAPFRPRSVGFNLPIHRAGGMSLDGMREALTQYGYLPEDASVNDAIDLLRTELRGEPVYTSSAKEAMAEEEQAAYQAELEAEMAAQSELGDLSSLEQDAVDEFADAAMNDRVAFIRGAMMSGLTEEEANATYEEAKQARDSISQSANESSQGTDATRSEESAIDDETLGIQEGAAPDWLSDEPSTVNATNQSETKRGEVGASLTKAERNSVLKTLVDVYKQNSAPKEFKGLDSNGNERYGYSYSPEYFVRSDITGALVRYYVTLPDGRVAHPTELFSDFTQSDIDAALQKQINEDKANEEGKVWRNQQIDSIANKSLQKVRSFRGEQFRKVGKTVPDKLVEFYSEDEGKWFAVEDQEVAKAYRNELRERGYREVSTYRNEAGANQPAVWMPKSYVNDDYSLKGETNEQAAANASRTESDAITKEQADRERDAVPFSLATESQPKPVGVQGDIFSAKRSPGRIDSTAEPETASQKPVGAFLKVMSRLLGKEIRWVKDMPEGDGMVVDTKYIYLKDGENSINLVNVFGHEFFHQLKVSHHEIWNTVKDVVEPLFTDEAKIAFYRNYEHESAKTMNDDEVLAAVNEKKDFYLEEFISDLGGNRFSEGDFWNQVFTTLEEKEGSVKAKTLVRRFVKALTDAIDKLMQALKLQGKQSFVADSMIGENLEAVKAALVSGMADYLAGVRYGTKWQDNLSLSGEKLAPVRAWHGSPHDHDKFDSSKIGTGEGAYNYVVFSDDDITIDAKYSKGRDGFVPDQKLIDAAKKHFMTTMDVREAGYIMPDGSMLDFSGKHYSSKSNWPYLRGQRNVDHRELSSENTHTNSTLESFFEKTDGSDMMEEFMAKTGAMRVDFNSGISSIMRPPTDAQLKLIGRMKGWSATSYIDPNNGRIVADIEWENTTPAKIRNFFEENVGKSADGNAPKFSKNRVTPQEDNKDGFWERINNGRTNFSGKEFSDALEGKLGGNGSGRSIQGSFGRIVEWSRNVAGFNGYYTLAFESGDGSFHMAVVPKELTKTGLRKEELADKAIVRLTIFRRPSTGMLELAVSEPDTDTTAYKSLESKKKIKKTDQYAENGHQYSRVDVGNSELIKLSRELIRRYAIAYGGIEDVFIPKRDTGKNPERPRLFSKETIESKFSKPRFFSQLNRSVENAPDKAITTGKQAAAWLQSNKGKLGIKDDELQWTGVLDWLNQQGKVTKQDVLDYLNDNQIVVQDVIKGESEIEWKYDGDDGWDYRNYSIAKISNDKYLLINPAKNKYKFSSFEEAKQAAEDQIRKYGEWSSPTKYGSYTLPGGENYKELLLTLPTRLDQKTKDLLADEKYFVIEDPEWKARIAEAKKKAGVKYRSSHWDEPNILAHIRINDRTDSDGNKVLFVEEVQSDWGQDGKKHGFEEKNRWAVEVDGVRIGEWDEKSMAEDVAKEEGGVVIAGSTVGSNIPQAPFVTKTEGWVDLALKRITMYAVQHGYDKVAFVNGEQSADRYNLQDTVETIAIKQWRPDELAIYISKPGGEVFIEGPYKDGKVLIELRNDTIRREQFDKWQPLEDVIGKELADRANKQVSEKGEAKLTGLDLQVGGEGMKTFYDRIVPQRLSKLLPKLGGGKSEEVSISNAENRYAVEQRRDGMWAIRQDGVAYGPPAESKEAAQKVADRLNGIMRQPGFTITPQMRESVGAGVPLFSKTRQTETPEFKRWFGDSKVVDENGKPLVMYHGTKADFSEFDISKFGKTDGGWAGKGFYFSPWEQEAGWYSKGEGGNIMPVYLSINNPLEWRVGTENGRELSNKKRKLGADGFSKWAQEQGYDGIHMTSPDVGSTRGQNEWIAFDPTQIKSAIGNNGQFDGSNPDIRYSKPRNVISYDEEYLDAQSLVDGVKRGDLLVHARVPDGTDFEYGIDPSAGEFLRSTESWKFAEEEYGEGPELTFFSDDFGWAKSHILKDVRNGDSLQLVFVRKDESIQKSLGDGKVQLSNGKIVYYEYSPIADHESDLFSSEPAGVETGDWYTNKTQDVVAVADASAIVDNPDIRYSPSRKAELQLEWKKITDVKKELSLDKLPDHITPFGRFMQYMADKARNGELGVRDVIKAYTIARSSMNRSAIATHKAINAGLELPASFEDASIRPEGAFSYWLLSPAGQQYLNDASRKVVNEEAISNAMKVMAPFGMQNGLGEDLRRAASGDLHNRVDGMTSAIIKAADGKNAVSDWQKVTDNLYGVREAKKGFLGSLLGFGQLPTFDARQINLNTPATKDATLRALSNKSARDTVMKLARRMDALDLSMDAEFAPFKRHLVHHAVWDKVGGTETTHSDVIEGMMKASPSRIVGASNRQYTAGQRRMFANTGREITEKSFKERFNELKKDFFKKMAVGIVDQFRGLRDLKDGGQAYMLARLSKGVAGAFEAILNHGKLSIKDGVYDADTSGGFIERVGVPLNGELEDFMWWMAANRADKLKKSGKENLFSDQDIADGKSLSDGDTSFDYTIQTGPAKGRVTRNRLEIYADAQRIFNEFNKNTLDMAEQSGLIDGASRPYWEDEFYIPFYRVKEEDNTVSYGKGGMGLVRQKAFQKLKGGTDKLNSDLLANTLLNWSHLIEASAKNRAAQASLEAAEKVGIATKVANGEKNSVWFMKDGEKVSYTVSDPFVMTAITSLEYAGMNNAVMKALSKFKHYLTVGVTADPGFKIRNLIRDSIQAIGTSDLGYNPITNLKEGWKATDRKSQDFVSALASGGLIRFGSMLENGEADRTRQLIKMGFKDSSILDSEGKWTKFYDKYLEPAWMAYQELGNRGEEINRAALYKQLVAKGVSHAEASLMARDLMDFSMQGSFTTIRFLTQVVPFLNARLQGLYKLGRAAKDDGRKMAIVTGAVAFASIALMLAYEDDEDWKRREDWDRDNYWWFKFAGMEFRIPKPFEIGAVATLAERSLEYMTNDEMTGERFAKVTYDLLHNNLAIGIVPQMLKPIADIYANKDSFTGRPIENMAMQRLDSTMRYNSSTSMVARGLSKATLGGLSPVEYDHMIRGYFGWLGTFVVGGADMALRPLSDEPERPTADLIKMISRGIAREEGKGSSRYVTMLYDQAKELEEAHATYRQLKKEGKLEDAQEYAEDNADKLKRYKQVESVKKEESKLNERIRMIERSNLSADEKRDLIDAIQRQKETVAKRIAPGYMQQ